MKGTPCAVAILLTPISAILAAQQHFPLNEDLRQLRTISSPKLSPDLKHVVVTVQDSTAKGGRTHLWHLSIDGGPYRQLTFNQGESSGGEKALDLPDGCTILFVSTCDGKSTLSSTVPCPNEPPSAVGVMSYSISPDGHTIAVVAPDPEPTSRSRDRKDKKRRHLNRAQRSRPSPALWKGRPRASRRSSAVRPSSISSVSMGPNPDPTETAGNRTTVATLRERMATEPLAYAEHAKTPFMPL